MRAPHLKEFINLIKRKIVMKKFVIFLILIIAYCQFSYGQNVESLMKRASKLDNVEKVEIGSFLMGLGKMFGGVSNMPVARGIKSMQIYELSSCNTDIKQSFLNDFKNIKDGNGYETLILARDKNDGIRIMVKKDKDIIKEMLFLCMDESDPVIIKLSGKIKQDDIIELASQYNK